MPTSASKRDARRQRRQARLAAAGLTRRALVPWDRLKFIILIIVVWFLIVWYQMANNPVLGFSDAARQQLQLGSGAGRWLVLLLGLEVLRQIYYLITEHSRHAYRASAGFFGRSEHLTHRAASDYTRFRLSRAFKWLLLIAVVAVILGLVYHTTPVNGLFQAPATIYHLLPDILIFVFYMLLVVAQFGMLFWFLSRGGVDVYNPGDITTRFADVWGQDHVVERVQENMLFLDDPESIEDHGGYVPGGILLWGPPGTGKTLMAEAIAGETGKPYVFVDPGAFINMFFGVGILKVKGLFRKLRKLAVRYGGVIVFFDEADSLGSRGGSVGGQPGVQGYNPASPLAGCHGFSYLSANTQSMLLGSDPAGADPAPRRTGVFRQILPAGAGMMGGGGMGTLQALLTEMSGLKKPRGFVNRVVRRTLGMRPKPPPKYRMLIIMATNMPSALDPALLRPGRIDRIYHVGYPSKDGRKRTYEGYFAKVSHEITPEQIDQLATMTPYATGATMKDLVNESLIVALRDGRTTITWPDVLRAKLTKSVGPAEGVDYVDRERHAVALHEACHAVTSYLTQKRKQIETATIQKGGETLGFVKPIPVEEQFTSWRSEFDAEIMVFVASLVGEKMFFDGDSSSGVGSDLQQATAISLHMESRWGMGGQIGSIAATMAPQDAHPILDGTDRNVLETALGKRAEARLETLAERTRALLTENRASVLAVGHALETYRTISGQDITAIMNREQGPVVDGRPYGQPDFIAELETYHLSAMAVQSRGRSLPLPVPSRHVTPELTVIPNTTIPNTAELRPESAD
ncbi:MAG TPA: AAA family ATPase [Streptosporangiaceae bacterium]|nr:AAA family ATPase [Streptosporangiaceae bacterium]